jgi:hypothetical protein
MILARIGRMRKRMWGGVLRITFSFVKILTFMLEIGHLPEI